MSSRVPGWADVVIAPNEPEAHLIAGILAEAGIATRLDGSRFEWGTAIYASHNPMSPIAIMVEEDDFDEARQILKDIDLSDVELSDEPEQYVEVLAEPRHLTWRIVVRWVAALIAFVFLLSFIVDNPLFPWR